MKIACIVLGVLACSYFGYVVGLSAYCDQVPLLQKTRKITWLIPFYMVAYFIYLLFARSGKDKWPRIKRFIKLPEKGAFFVIIFEDILTEEHVEFNSYKVPKDREKFNMKKAEELFNASNLALGYH